MDDDAQRFTANAAIVFAVHVGLIFAMSGSFIVPDLKPPPPPEAITIEIVTFDPSPEPEPEPAPIIVEPKPTPPPPAPVPAPRPQPKPQPKPEPRPEPTPPPPPPVPEIIPEPKPVITPPPPPPPEILVQPEPELLDPIVPEPEPLPEPIPEPLPEPEPIIEFFDPIPEPAPEPDPQPIIEFFEPVPEPVVEPEPIIEFIEPEPEIIPELDPLPIVPDLPPTPGVIEAEPLPEIIEPDPLPPEIILQPEPEPIAPEPVTPEPIVVEPEPLPLPDIVPTAPTVLASPDAPETREEEIRSVPQEQSDPFLDLLKKDRNSTLNDPVVTRPSGGGNQGPISQGGTAANPPGGGTRLGRTNPGAGGWTLAPQAPGAGKAYEGLNLDIRCREAGRTHEDCPEYLQTNKGRDRTGRESFNGFAGTGSDRGNRISESRTIPSRGSIGLNIGDNSINSGGPSTSVLDFQDTNFDREFVNKPLGLGAPPKGVLDIFAPNEPVKPAENWTFETPPAPPDAQEDKSLDWMLNKPPEE